MHTDTPPSKTQRKQASHELQKLGAELVALNDERLAAIEMPEALRDALAEYRRVRSHEGRRRQMQYIGKLMRGADVEPIRVAVAEAKLGPAQDSLALHEAERWRAELIADDDALTRLASRHRIDDLQPLRALIRRARADAAATPEQRSGRAYRDLFKQLRALIASPVMTDPTFDPVRIGLLSASDRASSGAYADQGLPSLQEWLGKALRNPVTYVTRLVPDDEAAIAAALRELVDAEGCALVLTTGGTGPAPRDVTPEATLAVATKVMPGFGEQMRQISLHFVPTAILSRQVAVIRGQALIINLPGQPKSIAETLGGLPGVPGIFAAVPYCIDLIGGPYLETDEAVCKAFRPKSAVRKAAAT